MLNFLSIHITINYSLQITVVTYCVAISIRISTHRYHPTWAESKI